MDLGGGGGSGSAATRNALYMNVFALLALRVSLLTTCRMKMKDRIHAFSFGYRCAGLLQLSICLMRFWCCDLMPLFYVEFFACAVFIRFHCCTIKVKFREFICPEMCRGTNERNHTIPRPVNGRGERWMSRLIWHVSNSRGDQAAPPRIKGSHLTISAHASK